jgi:hypothetical protein
MAAPAGNDQVRFELTYKALAQLKVIAPGGNGRSSRAKMPSIRSPAQRPITATGKKTTARIGTSGTARGGAFSKIRPAKQKNRCEADGFPGKL